MVILLDDARLSDVFRTLFGLSVADATVSRLLVRRLVRRSPPPGLPPQIARSPGFAALVLSAGANGTPFAQECERLRAEHDRLLAAAERLGEEVAIARALERLAGDDLALPPLDRIVAERRTFGDGARRRLADALARRSGAALEWRETLATPAAHATLDALVTALRYAAQGDEESARRLICSPLSGVPLVDARALIVASRGRASLAETISAQRHALGERSRAAAFSFLARLGAVRAAYRAQGARAGEVVATITAELDLRAADLVALAESARLARAVDTVDELTGGVWEIEELIEAFDAELDLVVDRPMREASPAPIADPMEEVALPPRRGHFSASALNTFAECERKWFFRYLCSAVEDKGSSASFYGTAFHSALQAFHERFPHIADLEPRSVQTDLEGCILSAFERYRDAFESNVEFELQRRRAVRTARKYGEWLVARSRQAPFTVVGCEIATELALDGFDFVGYIDRLDRDDRTGEMTVVDYKTGSIATSAAEYREKVLNFEDFQLPFYYWARTAAGDRVTRLVLLPLKEATADVLPIELEVVPAATKANAGRMDRAISGTISIDELRTARAKMTELCAMISSGTLAHFRASNDPQACRYCSYRPACRERPAPNEDRFGR